MNNDEITKRLQERISQDKGLQDLFSQRNNIDVQILSRQRLIKRESGLVVASLGDLKCEKHPSSSYEFLQHIPESSDLKVYACIDCKKENPVIPVRIFSGLKLSRDAASIAYDCPGCDGIVLGNLRVEDYNSPKEDWQALAGREGEHYHCNLCGFQLGSHYWKFS